jgi:hypothetical protein
VKYAFLRDELVGTCTTRMACRLLEVSPSGYYQFLQALPTPRKERRLAIERAVVRTYMRLHQISLSVTSLQTDQTRSGCATSLTFQLTRNSSTSPA